MSQKQNLPQGTEPDETPKHNTSGSGRGFFAVLVLCLIAVGGVAAATFSDSLQPAPLVSDSTTAPVTSATVYTTTSAAPVAAAAVTTTVTTVNTTTTQTTTEELFVLPLSNVVLTPFSEQPIYSETMDDYRAHLGVDFDGEESQPVRALADGTVSAMEQDTLWGGCVTLDHGDGIVSVYRGIDASVEVGATVKVGDNIGIVDAVPCESAMGPHLHLELYQNDTPVDVTALLSAQLTEITE